MNNIAICGCGTVGRGVKELSEKSGRFNLISVLDLEEKRAELGNLLVTDYHRIIDDSRIDTLIECLGGDELAYKIITGSLLNHKNVISSNKETISKHLTEYIKLAFENNVSLQFEAAVGGGIPLIYPLSVQSQFDEIELIRGILNGTSNFILTKMQEEHLDFSKAVKEAVDKGFAEKDPTADLKGLDMVRKASILASLATHREIHNEDIPHFGIENINSQIVDYLTKQKRILKLVAEVSIKPEGLSIIVLPVAIKPDDMLSHVEMENNGIVINGRYNQPVFILGKGAGRYPTASAIMQDLIRVENRAFFKYRPLGSYVKARADLHGEFIGFNQDNKARLLINPTLEELSFYKFICRVE